MQKESPLRLDIVTYMLSHDTCFPLWLHRLCLRGPEYKQCFSNNTTPRRQRKWHMEQQCSGQHAKTHISGTSSRSWGCERNKLCSNLVGKSTAYGNHYIHVNVWQLFSTMTSYATWTGYFSRGECVCAHVCVCTGTCWFVFCLRFHSCHGEGSGGGRRGR